ncbi:MBG domain-containing protein [Fulvivirga lutimaris]|uniref:MBG domain-containing protein n=1 Tax=Fulvivirga lutimaris TaxID=1819566 RepID=UPI0012BB769D|nr:MBG domain-containing protein [Fulvivirga lutimaris]MTI38399.1 T9SS type A sorting domain-containing protein [Fulvivirga lutimaris]
MKTFNLQSCIVIFLCMIAFSASAQQPIKPVVNCVEYDDSRDTYVAHFGYINSNDFEVTIPIGKDNKLTPSSQDRGQPTIFKPGSYSNVFEADFNGKNLTWHIENVNLKPSEATASSDISQCGYVTGVVRDARTGIPLVGVTVTVQGKGIQSVTGYDGLYDIRGADGEDVLVFSLYGYFDKEESIGYQSLLDVTLDIDPSLLEPVFASNVEGDDLWPELYYLADLLENGEVVESNDVFQIENGNVLVEVIANVGADMDQLRNILVTYGFYDETPNSLPLILTGYFPIDQLKELNNYDELINFVRPGYPPITNTGLVESQGDSALLSYAVRNGFGVGGEGVKVGVISDSYDAQGNLAATVVANGDLPGSEQSGSLIPVDVLKDNVRGSNEGLGMLEIIHDVAPKAQLGFRTGFLSSNDMARGIVEMVNDDYDVIVDDITYLSEPFAPTGQISQAVDYAAANGVHYLTSAGNFGDRSVGYSFSTSAADLPYPFLADNAVAHEFSSGDYLQQISLMPGIYVIEMQWEDLFYSQGDASGAAHDLDIWIMSQTGNLLYSGNRLNRGEDPIEIIAFKINEPTVVNVLITGDNIPEGLNFQYVVLRGNNWTFNEYYNPASTVVGHASSSSLSSVGAIFYGYTPAYTDDASLWEANPTSSRGGNLLGTSLAKPDFIAPDGGNTSNFGTDVEFDADKFPNFFGTSAAAPHAAGVLALVLESLDKFYDNTSGPIKEEITTTGLRELVAINAIDLGPEGFDNASGRGLIKSNSILGALANPSPQELKLIIPEGVTPGEDTFTLTVEGKYLTDETEILFRGNPLVITNTTDIDENTTQLETTIDPFIGNPDIVLSTPPKEDTNGSDGGTSEPAYFFTKSITNVVIKVNNATKKYGEEMPAFGYSTVPALSTEELELLPQIVFETQATSLSDVGVYFVSPSLGIDAQTGDSIQAPIQLKEMYDFTFENGALFIDPLSLKITPNNINMTYGDQLPPIEFTYDFGTDLNIPNRDQILASLTSLHDDQLVQDTVALLDRGLALVNRGLALVNESSWTISQNSLNRGLALVNGDNVVLVDASLLEEYSESPSGTMVNRGLALVNSDILADGSATITLVDDEGNVIGNRGLALVNRGLALVNEEVSGTSNSKVIVVVSEDDESIDDFNSINFITGLDATDGGEPQYIIPGAFYSKNFVIEYGVGELTINKTDLTLVVDDYVIVEGDDLPVVTSNFSGFAAGETVENVFGDAEITYTLSPAYAGQGGIYEIQPVVTEPSNYNLSVEPGALYVNPLKGSRIKVWMECTEMATNDPSGYQYRVFFSYENKNDTPWYIPQGSDNQLVGTPNYAGAIPEVFLPGQHVFDIEFDGDKISWQLTSNGTDKSSLSSSESVNSEGCSLALNVLGDVSYQVSPNPTQDYIVISGSSDVENTGIVVFDDLGFVKNPMIVKSTTDNTITINLESYPAGVYYVMLTVNGKSETLRVYKE